MTAESANRKLKIEKVEEIKKLISQSSSMVIVDYKGLTVAEDTQLRCSFRNADVTYKVLKNRLVKIALNELGYTQFDKYLEETNAFAFGGNDSIAPSRVVYESITKFKKLKAKCGLMDGQFIDETGVKALSELPSKEVLLSQLMGMLLAPVSALARVLNYYVEKCNE